MKTIPLSEAKDQLSALVEQAQSTHEQFGITRHGHPAAVLVAADEWEAMQETLFWLSQPGLSEDLDQSARDAAAGAVIGADEVRRRFGPEK